MDLNTPQGMLRKDADAMYLTLRFDYSTDTLYVPDGYIGDPRTFQAGFLDWLYHNPDYLLCDEKGHAVYHYDAATVLEYINQEVLHNPAVKRHISSPKNNQSAAESVPHHFSKSSRKCAKAFPAAF